MSTHNIVVINRFQGNEFEERVFDFHSANMEEIMAILLKCADLDCLAREDIIDEGTTAKPLAAKADMVIRAEQDVFGIWTFSAEE